MRKGVISAVIIISILFLGFYFHNIHTKTHPENHESQTIYYFQHKTVIPINYSSLTLNNTILRVDCRKNNNYIEMSIYVNNTIINKGHTIIISMSNSSVTVNGIKGSKYDLIFSTSPVTSLKLEPQNNTGVIRIYYALYVDRHFVGFSKFMINTQNCTVKH